MITRHALACGGVERHETGEGTPAHTWTTLWQEHNCYHVRSTQFEVPKTVWNSFDKLTDARKAYKRHVREYHAR